MEDVSNALCLLVSAKVTERKKGADLLKVCLEEKNAAAELSRNTFVSLPGRSSKRSNWDWVFDCVRTYVSLELEKIETISIRSTQRSSLNSTFRSSEKSCSRTKSLMDVVSLVKCVLEFGSSGSNGISPSAVILHVVKVLNDEGAQSHFGNDYLTLLNKFVLGNPSLVEEIKPGQWVNLAEIVFDPQSQSSFNPSVLFSCCKSLTKLIIDHSVCVDFFSILHFYKTNLLTAASVEKNTCLIPIISEFLEFMFANCGSQTICFKFLFEVLPAVFESLSKASVNSLSAKQQFLDFLTISAKVLLNFQSSDFTLRDQNMQNMYDVIVHSIELDLYQTDSKSNLSRKPKLAEKVPFFKLLQIVAPQILPSKVTSFKDDDIDSNCNTLECAPASKRHKKELSLRSWNQYACLFSDFCNESCLLYIVEMLHSVLSSDSVRVSCEFICLFLQKSLMLLEMREKYSIELKAKVIEFSAALIGKFDSFAECRDLCINVVENLSKYAFDNLASIPIQRKLAALLNCIISKFSNVFSVVEQLLNYFLHAFIDSSECNLENSIEVCTLIAWTLHNDLLGCYHRKFPNPRNWVRQNESGKSFVTSVIIWVLQDPWTKYDKLVAGTLKSLEAIVANILDCFLFVGVHQRSAVNSDVLDLIQTTLKRKLEQNRVELLKCEIGDLGLSLLVFYHQLVVSLACKLVSQQHKLAFDQLFETLNIENSVEQLINCCLQKAIRNEFSSDTCQEWTMQSIKRLIVALESLKTPISSSIFNSVRLNVKEFLRTEKVQQNAILRIIGFEILVILSHYELTENASQYTEAFISTSTVGSLEVIEGIFEDTSLYLPDWFYEEVLLKLTHLINLHQKKASIVSRIFVLFQRIVSEAFQRDCDNCGLVWKVSLPVFWLLIREGKFQDARATCALIDLSSKVIEVNPEVNYIVWNDDNVNVQIDLLTSEDYSEVAHLIVDQYLKGNRLIVETCRRNLAILINLENPQCRGILKYLTENITKFMWSPESRLIDDRRTEISRNLITLFQALSIKSSDFEDEVLECLSKLLEIGCLKPNEIQTILVSYGTQFKLQSQTYFRLILKKLVKFFEINQLELMDYVSDEVKCMDRISTEFRCELIEDLRTQMNASAVYQMLVGNQCFDLETISSKLELGCQEIDTLNLEITPLVIYQILSNAAIDDRYSLILRFLKMSSKYETSSLKPLETLRDCGELRDKLFKILKQSFHQRIFEVIQSLKAVMSYLNVIEKVFASVRNDDIVLDMFFDTLFCIVQEGFESLELKSSTVSNEHCEEVFSLIIDLISASIKLNWCNLIYELPCVLSLAEMVKDCLNYEKQRSGPLLSNSERDVANFLRTDCQLLFFVNEKIIQKVNRSLDLQNNPLEINLMQPETTNTLELLLHHLENGPKKLSFLKLFVWKFVSSVLALSEKESFSDKNCFLVQKIWAILLKLNVEKGDLFSLVGSEDSLQLATLFSQRQILPDFSQTYSNQSRVVLEKEFGNTHFEVLENILLDFVATPDLYVNRLAVEALQVLHIKISADGSFRNDFRKRSLLRECLSLKLSSSEIKDRPCTVLSFPQTLILSLLDELSADVSQILVKLVMTSLESALNLFPIIVTLLPKGLMFKLSRVFSDIFEMFLSADEVSGEKFTEQVLPFYHCVLDLMKYQLTANLKLSYFSWLELSFTQLSKVAFKLKQHMMAIFFADMSIMNQVELNINFGSLVPVDSCDYSEKLVECALKLNCEDSAVGLGLNRCESSRLQLMSYRYSTKDDSTTVSEMLSLINSISSRRDSNDVFDISDLIKGTPLEDLDILSSFSLQQSEWKPCSSEESPLDFKLILSQELSDWRQLSFLHHHNSVAKCFYAYLTDLHNQNDLSASFNFQKSTDLLKSQLINRLEASMPSLMCIATTYNLMKAANAPQNSLALLNLIQEPDRWKNLDSVEECENIYKLKRLCLQFKSARKQISQDISLENVEQLDKKYMEFLIPKGRLFWVERTLSQLREGPVRALINANLHWKRNNCSKAKFTLSTQLAKQTNEVGDKAELKLQMAKIQAESRSENTATIIEAIEDAIGDLLSDERRSPLLGQCYLTLAKFADQQYEKSNKFLKSEDFQRIQGRIDNVQKELDALSQQASKGSRYVEKLKLRQEMDKSEIEKIRRQRKEFLLKSLENYFSCLCSAGDCLDFQDLSMLRIIAQWFENYHDVSVNALVSRLSDQLSVDNFVHVLPQLIGRLAGIECTSSASMLFEETLQKLIVEVCKKHFFHGVFSLLAVVNSEKEVKHFSKYVKYTVDKNRVSKIKNVIEKIRVSKKSQLKAVEQLADAYMHTAYLEKGKNAKQLTTKDFQRNDKLQKISELSEVPIPTLQLNVESSGDYSKYPTILRFSKTFLVLGGLNKPFAITIEASDGSEMRQIVKGNDDLRQDAVMQQVFQLCNRLLARNDDARKRRLNMATYKVVPLAPTSGILQWCENTVTFADYLTGSKNCKGAHVKYRPSDLSLIACHEKMIECRENKSNQGDLDGALLRTFVDVCQRFQPVFHLFFLETFTSAEVWFDKKLNYTRSVAVSSIVGYILGLGDRHTSNILLNTKTAEVVHIDLGMAFEQGKEIAVPETVPFRLTRDLVSGFGISGVEGPFRKGCELTMQILRENRSIIATIAQVLVDDPLLNWTLSSAKALRMQEEENCDEDLPCSKRKRSFTDQSDNWKKNQSALRVIDRISAKLNGMDGVTGVDMLSVEGQVSWLIREATDFKNLSKLFHGWRAWV